MCFVDACKGYNYEICFTLGQGLISISNGDGYLMRFAWVYVLLLYVKGEPWVYLYFVKGEVLVQSYAIYMNDGMLAWVVFCCCM